MKKNYNPEIDGLRSIAVISVILFHFGVAGFSGGFVGVDIFFVISGFLISRLIFTEIQSNDFSYSNFFIRRARRLFPALFTTLLLTFTCSIFLLSPEDLEKLSGSLVYAAMSLSNMFFWQQSGYFDTEAALKPLLHTWSLSVEEQFYLFWPALLIFLYRTFQSRTTPVIIAAIGLCSLIASEKLLNQSPSASYYLMPLRIFEFAIGALLFWTQPLQKPHSALSDGLGLFGLLLIGYSINIFSELTRFPGLHALVPCLGTAMVIQAGPSRIIGRILGSRLAVSIGLISYSLYLTHWPIVVFYKYITDNSLIPLEQIGLFITTLTLSLPLYFLVEKPFRYKKVGQKTTTASSFGLGCSLLTLLIVLPAADAWANKGWTWRFKESEQFLTRYDINNREYVFTYWKTIQPIGEIENKAKVVYFLGDSQAADMLNAINSAGTLKKLGAHPAVYHIQYMCGAIFLPQDKINNFYKIENTTFLKKNANISTCEKQRKEGFSSKRLQAASLIILSPYWYDYLVSYLPGTIDKIREASQAPIIVIGQKHMLASSTGIFNKHKTLSGIELAASHFIDPLSVKINSDLMKISKEKNVHFFNPLDSLCTNSEGCKVVGRQGGPIMYDTHHLTPEGAEFVGSQFSKWLSQNGLIN